jgi:hypothetical protein
MKNNFPPFQKTTTGKSFLMLVLCILFLSNAFAGDIKIKQGNPQLKVTVNTNTALKAKNCFTSFTYKNIKSENGNFTELSVPDYGYSIVQGDPKLPVLKKLIEVPYGATVNVNVVSYSVKEYSLKELGIDYPLIPVQPSVSKDINKQKPEFKYNVISYTTDKFIADDIVKVEMVGTMRGVRLARLNISPVQYNPVKKTIRVLNDIEFEITFSGADLNTGASIRENTYSPYFESMYGSTLLNYKSLSTKDALTKYPVKYVIVADPMFQTALQPFITWKTKKGFKVIEAYTNNVSVGTTTTSIKNYLQGLYNAGTPSDPAPTFVLFVGDVAQIPAFVGSTNNGHVTDLNYCEYTGDYIPEMYYGRFSATSVAELKPQIDKTLEYEQYLMPDPSYLNNCVMIAGQDATYGPLHGDGQINYGTSTYFNLTHNLTSFTYLYAISGSSSASIIQKISDGVCYANYTAHGSPDGWYSPSFLVSNVSSLQNIHKYPLMVGNCCLTNKFDDAVCFGEALLRATDKGAIGYIGGSNSSYWDEDFYWGCGYKTVVVNPVYSASTLGAYDRTFHDHAEPRSDWYATQDQMIYAGNLAVTESGSSYTDYYWEIYHLMGDPSLMVYYSVPPAITATYSALIPIGNTTFTVNTEPWAYVGLSMNGVLYGAALADTNGVATLTINPFTIAGTADVVVTKQNRAPYIGTVAVSSPTGPYVFCNSKVIHDVAGNNNGQADFGEPVTLDVTLQNVGAASALGVTAVISTTDPYVTVTDNTQTWGTITNGSSVVQNNAYAFTVDNFIPDQHVVTFDMVITDNSSNSWNASFNVTLNAPVMKIGSITIDDATGNSNGRLDPGETVNVIIASSNTGHAAATNAVSTLSSPNSDITINSGTSNLGNLAVSGSANASFSITVSPSAVIGSMADFTNNLTSGLYSNQMAFSKMIGLVDEDWETGTFAKFSWVNSTYPWTITSTDPYEGTYCAKSGAITDQQNTDLSITFNVLANDSISFYKKVSSEDNYDFLNFYIDANQVGEWSGTTDVWSRVAYPVTTGNHTFKWSYVKDQSLLGGSDCAWIDYILFPAVQLFTSVDENATNETSLSCFPNPIVDNALIYYNLEKADNIRLMVYNSIGQEVVSLISSQTQAAGKHQIYFNASGLKSGVYYCILKTSESSVSSKVIITK